VSPAATSAAAGQHLGPRQPGAGPGRGGRAVQRDAGADGAEDRLAGRGVRDAAGNSLAVLDERDRHAPFGNAFDELAGAVERIDHPDAPCREPGGVVGGLLGQPAVARLRQQLEEEGIHGVIGLGDRVIAGLHRHGEVGADEAGKGLTGPVDGVRNPLQILLVL
jgi:hypothetical protein